MNLAIVDLTEQRYHYHLGNDTKYDQILVDGVIRDLIQNYDITDQDHLVQSDNASSPCKNKYSFSLIQTLEYEFNLHFIRTYGAASHRKGTIDGMLIFGVKNGAMTLSLTVYILTTVRMLLIIFQTKTLSFRTLT